MTAQPLTLFFKDIDKDDIPIVGGKGANLGEMTKAGFPVPPGFAITVASYELFLNENNLNKKISDIQKVTDTSQPDQLEDASRKIRKLILFAKIPEEISIQTIKAYKKLSGRFKSALVAVRSSATAEDLPTASFAGQQATFLNIKGEANLMENVRKCWASLFTPRAIFYREENKINHEKVKISVIVQKMIQSEVSGVVFSIDPVTNEKDRIVIEAIWGLGEMIVQGSVIPDRYIVQKETFDILSKEVSDQPVQLIKVGLETKEVSVSKKLQSKVKLNDDEILKLAKIVDSLQKHYYFPQDSEWAKEKGKIYIVQTRPVTTIKQVSGIRYQVSGSKGITIPSTPILTGVGASPGVGTGVVKILKSPKEINKVEKGDVLVARMTSPDYVPAMKKASAIVTDEGGLTSHAAIVSREMGIPCVVGSKEATKKLREGWIVSVNGSTGEIFMGFQVTKQLSKQVIKLDRPLKTKTATKLYVNLAEPDRAKEISKLNVDGVGLLRAEFMMAGIGLHPKEAIKTKKQENFIKKLSSDLELFCQHFDPRPVIYRATDFKTNEYRSLSGGKYWEPEEPNPLMGFRGAFRYITWPDVFNLELQAIKKVRIKYKNLHLMVPFVRSPAELAKIKNMIQSQELFSESSFSFWMMVELPVNVILIEDFLKVGVDGVSIGSNDLTMLLQGTDRDNSEVARSFNETAPEVLWSIKRVIKKCLKNNVKVSICGQAPSEYEDLVRQLVRWGITSISVNPDAINRVRQVIMETEKKL